MKINGISILMFLCMYATVTAMEQQLLKRPVLPATAAAIAAQAQEHYSPIRLVSKQQAPGRARLLYIINGNAIKFSNFIKTQIPFEMRRQRVDNASQLGPIEIGYAPNHIAFIAAILNFLPNALKDELTTQAIAEQIIQFATQNEVSFAEGMELIEFFDIPMAFDALISIRQPMPLPINRAEAIDYNSQLIAIFRMAKSHNNNHLWQLFGRMLYPICDTYSDVAEMLAFITAQKDIERVVLGAYMQQHPELYKHRIEKLESYGNVVAFSPDGKMLALGFSNDTIRLWNLVDGSSRKLEGGTAGIISVAFSPDGRMLALGLCNGNIRLWNIANGSSREIDGYTGRVGTFTFSPDGKMLALGLCNGNIRLWNVADGSSRELRDYRGEVLSVAFSPDGKTLASYTWTNTIQLRNVADGSLKELEGHKELVNSVVFSPDGSILASGSDDHTIRLWNISDGSSKELKGHTEVVNSVAFSPDGSMLASGSNDSTIRLWNIADGSLQILNEYIGKVRSVIFNSDGRIIATCSNDKFIRLYGHMLLLEALQEPIVEPEATVGRSTSDVFATACCAAIPSVQPLPLPTSPVQEIEYNKQLSFVFCSACSKMRTEAKIKIGALSVWQLFGRMLYPGCIKYHEIVKMINFITTQRDRRIEQVVLGAYMQQHPKLYARKRGMFRDFSRIVRSAVFSPDGRTLAFGSGKTIRLWNIANGSLRELKGHTGTVYSVSFSPDGKTLASGSSDNTIRLWNFSDGLLRGYRGCNESVDSVAFSPDGRTVASGSDDGTIQLWNIADGSSKELRGHRGTIYSVVFSPDGTMLASCSMDNTIRLWRVAGGSLLQKFSGPACTVLSVAFSPDGRTFASGSNDNTIRLLNVANRTFRELRGHIGCCESLAFSHDGSMLVSGSWNGTIRLWNIADGLSRELRGHTGRISSVVFSPDGSMLASGSDDGPIRLWNIVDGSLRGQSGSIGLVDPVCFSHDERNFGSDLSDSGLCRPWGFASLCDVLQASIQHAHPTADDDSSDASSDSARSASPR